MSTVATAVIGPVQQPGLAGQDDGTALLTWVDVDTTSGQGGTVRALRRVGGVWGAPVTLGNTTNLLGVIPRPALDGAGRGVVSWAHVRPPCGPGCSGVRDNLIAARFDGVWSAGSSFALEGSPVAFPDVAMNGAGRFRAIYTSEIAGTSEPHSQALDTVWAAPDVLVPALYADRTTIAGTPDGTYAMAWSGYDGFHHHAYAAMFPFGGAGPVEDLAADTGSDAVNVAIAARPGTAALAFVEWHPTTNLQRVIVRRWVPGGWSSPTVLATCTAPDCFVDNTLDVAVDNAGTAWVAWVQRDTATGPVTVRVDSL